MLDEEIVETVRELILNLMATTGAVMLKLRTLQSGIYCGYHVMKLMLSEWKMASNIRRKRKLIGAAIPENVVPAITGKENIKQNWKKK